MASDVLSLGDVDRDGDLDVLSAGSESLWWENADGSGSAWSPHSTGTTPLGPSQPQWVDLDQDGDGDLAGALPLASGDGAYWLENVGDGTAWVLREIDASFEGALSLAAGDLDGDGRVDVVAGSAVTEEVVLCRNVSIPVIFRGDFESGGLAGWSSVAP